MRSTLLAASTLACIVAYSTAVRADAPPATPAAPPAAAAPTSAEPVQAPAHAAAPAARESGPVSAASEATAEERAEQERMICKKATETGTLGRKKKVCMTAEQWEAHRQAARSTMRGIDNAAGTQNSGVPGGG